MAMTCWLITSTFYGQWLPGDERGSIANVRDRRAGEAASDVRREHDRVGEAYERAMPGLKKAARGQLKGPPVWLTLEQAEELLDQFLETADYRGWVVHAVSIMANHVHVVVEAPREVGKSQLLRDLKGYGSRRLNQVFGERASGTWWTDGGSGRVVRDLASPVFYVCYRQAGALVVWERERGRIAPSESDPGNRFERNSRR
jgi:REP element-mobilizing transposase RayT